MSRWWNETIDSLSTVISLPLLVFLSVVATILIALAWYFWPHWLPWRWWPRGGHRGGEGGRSGGGHGFRLRLGRLRWRLRWRRRRKSAPEPLVDEPAPDELPDLPAAVLTLTADELAAAGRYAEAVRERLRAIVRDLVERDLIPPSPGWTATELARQAVRELPALAGPLDAAVETFSRIWYGLMPAEAGDDAAMRAHAAAIATILTPAKAAAPTPAGAAA